MTDQASAQTPRVGRLHKLGAVRVELRNVYADARQGRIDSQEATRLAYVLSILTKVLEVQGIDSRLDALEAAMAANPATRQPLRLVRG